MKKTLLTLFLVFAGPMLLINCNGNKGGGSASAPINPANAGACLQTTRGCLPQGTCPPNFGQQGSDCLPATGLNGVCEPSQLMTQFGCLPTAGCAAGKAMYENSCVPGARPTYNTQYPY